MITGYNPAQELNERLIAQMADLARESKMNGAGREFRAIMGDFERKSLPIPTHFDERMTVVNKLGIHARPAAMFVKTASRFTCDILSRKMARSRNGKSIMGLMMLAAGRLLKLTIHAGWTGMPTRFPDRGVFFQRKFDEED